MSSLLGIRSDFGTSMPLKSPRGGVHCINEAGDVHDGDGGGPRCYLSVGRTTAVSGREWSLDDLFAVFPEVSRGTDRVLRCLWRTSGEGRYIKEHLGSRRWASVAVAARPSDRFCLRLTNTWPASLTTAETQVVETELLRGLLEGTVRCEDPPWRCHLECASVDWSPIDSARSLIRPAASQAVESLVAGGAWEAIGSPGDHVA
jgi:hypothetical protein